jgi:four helix bundle protein
LTIEKGVFLFQSYNSLSPEGAIVDAGNPSRSICERTFNYAIRAIELFDHLQQSDRRAAWVIANQYLRSATSVGANMEEAQAGESRSDFAHKCHISLKEARESLFWLRLLQHARFVKPTRLEPLIQETREIVAILTTIVVKTKRPFRIRVPLIFTLLLGF